MLRAVVNLKSVTFYRQTCPSGTLALIVEHTAVCYRQGPALGQHFLQDDQHHPSVKLLYFASEKNGNSKR